MLNRGLRVRPSSRFLVLAASFRPFPPCAVLVADEHQLERHLTAQRSHLGHYALAVRRFVLRAWLTWRLPPLAPLPAPASLSLPRRPTAPTPRSARPRDRRPALPRSATNSPNQPRSLGPGPFCRRTPRGPARRCRQGSRQDPAIGHAVPAWRRDCGTDAWRQRSARRRDRGGRRGRSRRTP